MEITNKKELLAALLSEEEIHSINNKGQPGIDSLFKDLAPDRARAISKEIIDNLREEFNRHPIINLTPQDYIRIAARNIDLNTQEERLHFLWQAGIAWSSIMDKLAAMEPTIRQPPTEPPQPFIGEN